MCAYSDSCSIAHAQVSLRISEQSYAEQTILLAADCPYIEFRMKVWLNNCLVDCNCCLLWI